MRHHADVRENLDETKPAAGCGHERRRVGDDRS
jgi:hypothetical protein